MFFLIKIKVIILGSFKKNSIILYFIIVFFDVFLLKENKID